MNRIISLLAVLAVALAAVGGAGTASAGTRASNVDIVQTAVAAGQFTTLASLLEKAGLVDTLAGGGPFTVFAPTDAAFAKVPKATLDALAADPAKLKSVLLYHVVLRPRHGGGRRQAHLGEDARGQVGRDQGRRRIGLRRRRAGHDARRDDHERRHPRDRLGAAAQGGCAGEAEDDRPDGGCGRARSRRSPRCSRRRDSSPRCRGRARSRSSPRPTRRSRRCPRPPSTALAKDKAKLRSVLLYHVVKGNVPAAKVVKLRSAKTLNGQPVSIRVNGGKVFVGGARVTTTDVKASNGVIHVVNKVLIP